MSADSPERLQDIARKHREILFLSDPGLTVVEAAEVPVSTAHPMALTYPERAFHQPCVFIYDRAGEERFAWRIRPSLGNLYGAARRLTPGEILARTRALAGPAAESG